VEDLCAQHMLRLGLTRRPTKEARVVVSNPEDDEPIPMGVRIVLLLMFGGYLVYAWGVGVLPDPPALLMFGGYLLYAWGMCALPAHILFWSYDMLERVTHTACHLWY
jgi:hypothetical protein